MYNRGTWRNRRYNIQTLMYFYFSRILRVCKVTLWVLTSRITYIISPTEPYHPQLYLYFLFLLLYFGLTPELYRLTTTSTSYSISLTTGKERRRSSLPLLLLYPCSRNISLIRPVRRLYNWTRTERLRKGKGTHSPFIDLRTIKDEVPKSIPSFVLVKLPLT